MKKNAWVKYWERVHRVFIHEGFGYDDEEDSIYIKIVYFALFLGMCITLGFFGFEAPFNFVGRIIDFFPTTGFGGALSMVFIVLMVGGFFYSLYFIYVLIKCLFIK